MAVLGESKKLIMNRFTFLKAYFSPFKPLKLRFYIGKIAVGTPYFLPRRWVKSKDKPGYMTPIPKKIGFDFVALGWKTKWDEYRLEWAPIWSFVFFRWQIAIIFKAPHEDHYWESWLFYENDTNKTKSKKERIKECKEKSPSIWTVSNQGVTTTIDYYTKILRKKYL